MNRDGKEIVDHIEDIYRDLTHIEKEMKYIKHDRPNYGITNHLSTVKSLRNEIYYVETDIEMFESSSTSGEELKQLNIAKEKMKCINEQFDIMEQDAQKSYDDFCARSDMKDCIFSTAFVGAILLTIATCTMQVKSDASEQNLSLNVESGFNQVPVVKKSACKDLTPNASPPQHASQGR